MCKISGCLRCMRKRHLGTDKYVVFYRSDKKTAHACFPFCVYTDFYIWIYTTFLYIWTRWYWPRQSGSEGEAHCSKASQDFCNQLFHVCCYSSSWCRNFFRVTKETCSRLKAGNSFTGNNIRLQSNVIVITLCGTLNCLHLRLRLNSKPLRKRLAAPLV